MRFRLVRIVVPTAGMSILLLLLGGVAAWYLHGLQRDSSELLIASVAKVEAAEELEVISHELRDQLSQYQAGRGSQSLAAANQLHSEANEWLAKAAELAAPGRETQLIGKIDQGYQRLFQTFQGIVQDAEAGGDPSKSFDRVHDMTANDILQPAKEFRRLSRMAMLEASQRNQTLADRLGMELLLLGSCGAVAGLLAGYGIARGIHRSLAQLTIPVRDATGKLNQVIGPLTVSAGESFEELESALQAVANRIGEVIRQLQESQLAASRAQQLAAMGQLAAGLAHELRNPLTSMKMLVQPGEDDAETVQLDAQDLTILREEIDRLERTIQVFLDYARPPTLQKHPVFLREFLKQAIEFIAPRARQLGIGVALDLPEQIVQIDADAAQIRQVLLNLLLNALEASTEGDTISVRLCCEPDGGCADGNGGGPAECGWVRIEVADRGPGLPAEIGQRIFEPFVSTKEAGTGLGLPICKRIVEDHGGEILAKDRQGGGALFVVRLPVRADRPETEAVAGRRANREPAQPGEGGNGHLADR